jgi:lipid II:glycine glycyltransferase (peptidoglycan interpeptide bridge formation enzyme)
LAKSEGCVFVRLAPTLKRTPENEGVFRLVGYKRAPIFVQSELSWRLNLLPSIEELLAGMRKSTRYILRREESYGVAYDSSDQSEDFERFYNLYKETVKNQEYVGHSKDFIEEEFKTFAEVGGARLYFAYTGDGSNKTDLAAAMVITQGVSGFYHYGGSRKDEHNTPAPHLLQWHIIRDLKSRGFSYYNFWGIAEDDKPNHPWRGLTIFKKGFGGEELAYLKTQDYIIGPLYWFNWAIETIRRIKRNY